MNVIGVDNLENPTEFDISIRIYTNQTIRYKVRMSAAPNRLILGDIALESDRDTGERYAVLKDDITEEASINRLHTSRVQISKEEYDAIEKFMRDPLSLIGGRQKALIAEIPPIARRMVYNPIMELCVED